MKHWLMKSEPSTFGVDDLEKAPKRTTCWDGVRNYQARNMLRDEFSKGDLAFLYHSSCEVPGIVAVMKVTRPGYPDESAFDPKHDHYDPDSRRDAPRWFGPGPVSPTIASCQPVMPRAMASSCARSSPR